MTHQERLLRRETIRVARMLTRTGLTLRTSGNVSVRVPSRGRQRFIITPSSMAYDLLKPEDLATIYSDGTIRGKWKPSIEKDLHAEIYAEFPHVHAIVHADSYHASTMIGPVPLFGHMIMSLGGTCIPYAQYQTPGSIKLARGAFEALKDGYHACILGQHGLVACGKTLDEALGRAQWLEELSKRWKDIVHLCKDSDEPLPIRTPAEAEELEEVFQKYNK